MKILGLTGGIATGKSTIAKMFAQEGVPIFDADAYVHALYQSPQMIAQIEDQFPEAVIDEIIDRKILGRMVFSDDKKLKTLEGLLHPKVRQAELDFIEKHRCAGKKAVLMDIPLLFESEAHGLCDLTIITDCEPATQRARVLARPFMSEEKLDAILARQMPRQERLERADMVISTDQSFERCEAQVKEIISSL